MRQTEALRVSAVLLAAGESTRMGQLKALLPWQGTTLLQHQVAVLLEAGAREVVVVLGHRAVDLVTHVRGKQAHSVFNPDYPRGKTTSIRLGVRSVSPGAQGVLLLAVDQPRTVGIVKRLLEEHQRAGALITSPVYQGHGGHPLLFSASLLPELQAIEEATQGVRAVMERHASEVHPVPFDTPLVTLDVNSPDEYQEALRLFALEG